MVEQHSFQTFGLADSYVERPSGALPQETRIELPKGMPNIATRLLLDPSTYLFGSLDSGDVCEPMKWYLSLQADSYHTHNTVSTISHCTLIAFH